MERSHRPSLEGDEECLNARAFRKPGPREHAIKRFLDFYPSPKGEGQAAPLSPGLANTIAETTILFCL